MRGIVFLRGLRDWARFVCDWQKDPNPENWRTIKGAKVHLDQHGNYDGGAGGKFNGNHHYGPDWREKSQLMKQLTKALRGGVKAKGGLPKKEEKPESGGTSNVGGNPGAGENKPAVLDINNLPQAFGVQSEQKHTKALIEALKGITPTEANKSALDLYNNLGKALSFVGVRKVSHTKSHKVAYYFRHDGAYFMEVDIPRLGNFPDEIKGEGLMTTLHELLHAVDFSIGKKKGFRSHISTHLFDKATEKSKDLLKGIDYEMGEDVKKLFEDFNRKSAELAEEAEKKLDEIKKRVGAEYIEKFGELAAKSKEGQRKINRLIAKEWNKPANYDKYLRRAALGGGVPGLMDIYSALMAGYPNYPLTYGHSQLYYASRDSRIKECMANYAALKIVNPKLLEMLHKDKPELAEALEKTLNDMQGMLVEAEEKEEKANEQQPGRDVSGMFYYK